LPKIAHRKGQADYQCPKLNFIYYIMVEGVAAVAVQEGERRSFQG